MTNRYKIALGFSKLEKPLKALEIMASAPPQEHRAHIDATIQRFEFTIELFWKLLKAILEYKGINVQYPKDVLKEAYQGDLIDHETVWLNMMQDRNLTSHTYDENLADKIYQHIQSYVPVFRVTFDTLAQQDFS